MWVQSCCRMFVQASGAHAAWKGDRSRGDGVLICVRAICIRFHALLREKCSMKTPAPRKRKADARTRNAADGLLSSALRSTESLQQAVGALGKRLREAEARESHAAVRIGGLSHDLRNALLIIAAHVELALEDTALSTSTRDDLQRILRATEQATAVVSQLNPTCADSAVPHAEPVCLNDAIRGACDLLNGLVDGRIELVQALNATAPVALSLLEIERIVIDLIVHAREDMQRGGVVVIETKDVLLPAGAPSERLQIPAGAYTLMSVRDNGRGMARADLDRLFRPVFGVHRRRGVGLGLATVAALVEWRGGAVDVESEPGMGTALHIYMPSMPSAATPAEQLALTSPARLEPSAPEASAATELEALRGEHGQIRIGWIGADALFASFHGVLSNALGEAYADHLERLLEGRTNVRYFLDSSALDSFELRGRDATLRALARLAPSFKSVLVLKWAGGESPAGQSAFQHMGHLIRSTRDRAEFDAACRQR
jgi:signal transduction histidine kinase